MKLWLTSLLTLSMLIRFCEVRGEVLKIGQTISHKCLPYTTDTFSIELLDKTYFHCILQDKESNCVLHILDPSLNKISSFYSPNDLNGNKNVVLEVKKSGTYKIIVQSLVEGSEDTAEYILTNIKVISRKEYQSIAGRQEANEKATLNWLGANLISLQHVTAGHDFDDLEPLKSALENVTVVGLGEATHGTREFFQLKHRLLEFLVRELGFNCFAIEASFAGCKNINDYIMYGKGTAYSALATQGFWTWDTEEVITMIEWMRSYNKPLPDEKKIRFFGFDIQKNLVGGSIGKIQDYLANVDPNLKQDNDSLFTSIILYEKGEPPVFSNARLISTWQRLVENVKARQKKYLSKSTKSEFEDIFEYLTVVNQYLDAYLGRQNGQETDSFERRDYYMARNLLKYIQQGPKDLKVVVWAHNNHVCKNASHYVNGSKRPLGSYLQVAYGKKYYAFGFLFDHGTFQARGIDSDGIKGLAAYSVPVARKNSLEWYLASTRSKNFIINFRQSIPLLIRNFCSQKFFTRNYGSTVMVDSYQEDYLTPVIITSDFDGLIFINKTSRSTPTATGRR